MSKAGVTACSITLPRRGEGDSHPPAVTSVHTSQPVGVELGVAELLVALDEPEDGRGGRAHVGKTGTCKATATSPSPSQPPR